TAKKGKIQFTKTGFVGRGEENRYALYLNDNQRPMVIVGNSMIIGDALLPQRGIKMGNIHGYGYTRPQLVYGRTKQSNTALPRLNEGTQRQLDKLTGSGYVPKRDALELEKNIVITNSFLEEPKMI